MRSAQAKGRSDMNVLHAQIPEVLIIEPTVLADRRGYFCEIYQEERYASHGITGPFVQDNLSRSRSGGAARPSPSEPEVPG